MLATALTLLLSAATTASPRLRCGLHRAGGPRPAAGHSRCRRTGTPTKGATDPAPRRRRPRTSQAPARPMPSPTCRRARRRRAPTDRRRTASGAACSSATTSFSSISAAPAAHTRSPARRRSGTRTSAYVAACLASLDGDPTQYGSAAAADDLDAVRAVLGYRSSISTGSRTARRSHRSISRVIPARCGRSFSTGRR